MMKHFNKCQNGALYLSFIQSWKQAARKIQAVALKYPSDLQAIDLYTSKGTCNESLYYMFYCLFLILKTMLRWSKAFY